MMIRNTRSRAKSDNETPKLSLPTVSAPAVKKGEKIKRSKTKRGETLGHVMNLEGDPKPDVKRRKYGKSTLNILESLPENIVAATLFSGYFNSIFMIKNLMLVSKKFFELGKESIHALDLRSLSITSTDFIRISTQLAKNLIYIDLSYTKLDDEFISGLCCDRIKNQLLGLSLRGTGVTDISVRSLNSFPRLRWLDLSQSSNPRRISDASITSLTSLSKLQWFDLSGTDISDASLSNFPASHPNLVHLGLACCVKLTNRGLAHLANLKMQTLDITGCIEITDFGFDPLINNR